MSSSLTAEQKIKREILEFPWVVEEMVAVSLFFRDHDSGDVIDDLWSRMMDDGGFCDLLSDALGDFRSSGDEIDIPCETSRHYCSHSVARLLACGDWVGWTYWYGGGKHGEPDAIDWLSDAYNLIVTEEEKLVVVRTYTKEENTDEPE